MNGTGSLAFARTAAVRLLDSTCVITRDPDGAEDDAYDPASHTFDPLPEDANTIYSGSCRIRPGAAAQGAQEAGQTVFLGSFIARLPVTAVNVAAGDVLTITTSTTDQQLVGAAFTVDEVDVGSTAITRVLVLTRRQRGAPS